MSQLVRRSTLVNLDILIAVSKENKKYTKYHNPSNVNFTEDGGQKHYILLFFTIHLCQYETENGIYVYIYMYNIQG